MKSEKIDEWIREVEERPSSAPVILQYIANRLRDLTNRNEELMEEIIALQSGERVEEYEKRIAHLEYQLELIKRQLNGEPLQGQDAPSSGDQGGVRARKMISILVYDVGGRVLRIELDPANISKAIMLGEIRGEGLASAEAPRLLAIPSKEELLFLFSSGRIATLAATNIPPAKDLDSLDSARMSAAIDWKEAVTPIIPHAGESLACIAPISRLALADSFVQASRRGFFKKIRIGMADSILQNHYIGAGVKKPADTAFDLFLGRNDDRLVVVTWEGFTASLEVKNVPVAIEEVMQLGSSDHLAAVVTFKPGDSLLVMTNIGKVVQLAEDRIAVTTSFRSKGQAVFSARRRSEGVRVAGAISGSEEDWCVVLERTGSLSLHPLRELIGSGTLPDESEPIAFSSISISATGE